MSITEPEYTHSRIRREIVKHLIFDVYGIPVSAMKIAKSIDENSICVYDQLEVLIARGKVLKINSGYIYAE